MNKKRPASVFFTAVFAIILYFIFFPYPLGRELVARPSWSVELPADAPAPAPAAVASAPDSPAFPFQLGGVFGYVGSDGTIVRTERTLFRVALSSTGSINYTRVGTDWIMVGPRGNRRLSFSGTGYPFLSSDGSRVFVVNSDLTGVLEIDPNGDPGWKRDFPAVITSISLQGDYLLVGLLNGSLQLINRQGAPVFQGAPGGSRIPVVYGCAVSPNGQLMGVVSGIDPQLMTVLEKSGSAYNVMEKRVLQTDFRREARIQFSPDSRYLLFEDKDSTGFFDPEERRLARLGLPGMLAGTAFLGDGRITALASADKGRVALRLVSPFLGGVSSESFSASDFFLGTIDGQLLLGIDGRLLRVNVEAL